MFSKSISDLGFTSTLKVFICSSIYFYKWISLVECLLMQIMCRISQTKCLFCYISRRRSVATWIDYVSLIFVHLTCLLEKQYNSSFAWLICSPLFIGKRNFDKKRNWMAWVETLFVQASVISSEVALIRLLVHELNTALSAVSILIKFVKLLFL
jgi:hypothetical protein